MTPFLKLMTLVTPWVSLLTETLCLELMPTTCLLSQRRTRNIVVEVTLLMHRNLWCGALAF